MSHPNFADQHVSSYLKGWLILPLPTLPTDWSSAWGNPAGFIRLFIIIYLFYLYLALIII